MSRMMCHVHNTVLRKDLPAVLTLPKEAPPSTTEEEALPHEERGSYEGLVMQIADTAAGGTNQLVAPDEQNALGRQRMGSSIITGRSSSSSSKRKHSRK
jgi:hypothetical protein